MTKRTHAPQVPIALQVRTSARPAPQAITAQNSLHRRRSALEGITVPVKLQNARFVHQAPIASKVRQHTRSADLAVTLKSSGAFVRRAPQAITVARVHTTL